jgi:phage terminase small subunit
MGRHRNDFKRQRFVEEYLVDLNAKEATIRAGYSTKGAKQQGHRLLSDPEIAAAVKAAQKAQVKRIRMTADDVLVGLAEIASVDIADIFDEDNALRPLRSIPAHVRKAIAGIEVEELFEGRGKDREHIGRNRKLKLSDKVRALEILARHHKLLTEKVELTGADGGPIAHALTEMSEEQLRALAGQSRRGAGTPSSD